MSKSLKNFTTSQIIHLPSFLSIKRSIFSSILFSLFSLEYIETHIWCHRGISSVSAFIRDDWRDTPKMLIYLSTFFYFGAISDSYQDLILLYTQGSVMTVYRLLFGTLGIKLGWTMYRANTPPTLLLFHPQFSKNFYSAYRVPYFIYIRLGSHWTFLFNYWVLFLQAQVSRRPVPV